MNQGYTLPRSLIKWIDSLDLAYSVRNVRKDIANGFIVAEILARYYPKEVALYSFDNGLKKDKRQDNWVQISKILGKKDFQLTQKDYEPIYNQAPDAALDFMCKLYEHLTRKKLKLEQRQKLLPQLPLIPSYAKPTANTLAKDRELVRIVDEDEKKRRTENLIEKHNDQLRQQKQDSNIIEYLIIKRRQQLEEQLKQEEEALLERKRKYGNIEQISQPDIKEIQLKSYKSSTSKKNKEQQGQLMEQKGIYENLFEQSNSLMEKEGSIDKELTKLGIEKKNVVFEIFNRCEEVSIKTMETFLTHFQENCIDIIIETLNNNFIDFKKFFHLFLKAIVYLEQNSSPYMQIVLLYKRVATDLVKQDPQVTQMMFESIVLKDILQIVIKCPGKRESLVDLFYFFCSPDSLNRLHLIKKIKEFLVTDLNNFINILSVLIQQHYDDFDEDLYNIFFFYAFVGLDNASPRTRTNCLKIINEISLFNYQPIITKIKKLHRLVSDQWWEVSSQILIICSNLLLFLAQEDDTNPENQRGSQNGKRSQIGLEESIKSDKEPLQDQDFNKQELQQMRRQKQDDLIEIVKKLFKSKTSQNILRIGLVYLAPVLNYYPSLCDRYLQILLEISEKKRETVLMTNPVLGMEEGQIVLGCQSFRYKLTSAPVTWNSVGIAQSMDKYVQEVNLKNFEREHLEILQGCLYNPLEQQDAQTWIAIYEKLKNHIFFALCEKELCALASDNLMKIFLFDEIQNTVLENSFGIFLKLLKMIYHPDIDKLCKQNLLQFFEFLNNEKESVFKKYTYNIIKKFSEENKNMFLRSNLVEFMNTLALERRDKQNF